MELEARDKVGADEQDAVKSLICLKRIALEASLDEKYDLLGKTLVTYLVGCELYNFHDASSGEVLVSLEGDL